MNYLDIQCFLHVAKNNSITRAADELFLTRQTVSNHISQLEKELDCKLFVRTPTSFHLSPEGLICYDFFTDVKKSWDYTRSTAANMCSEHLRIGCDFSLDAGQHFSDLCIRFRKQYPDKDIEVTTDDSIFLINQLNDDELDLVIIKDEEPLYKTNRKKYNSCAFTSIELVLLVSNHHPIKGKTAADYAKATCYIGNSTVHTDKEFSRILQKNLYRACGIQFQNIQVLPNMDSVHSTVLFSNGMTIDSTDCGILHIPGQVQSFPLGIKFHMIAVWKKTTVSDAISAFTDLLRASADKDDQRE